MRKPRSIHVHIDSDADHLRDLRLRASLWRRDTDCVGSAGADGAAVDGVELLIEADFYGAEEVVAAGERQ